MRKHTRFLLGLVLCLAVGGNMTVPPASAAPSSICILFCPPATTTTVLATTTTTKPPATTTTVPATTTTIKPPATTTTVPATTTTTTPAGVLKPEISGVLDRAGVPASNYLSSMSGWVVNVRWADLQLTQNGPIDQPSGGNAIDQAIAQVKQINQANPGYNLRLKLRLTAGIDAPDWAKNLNGAPFTMTDPNSNVSGTVGRFWMAAYGSAYADFLHKIASLYDSVPQIRDVTLDRCMTIYAEPFQRQINDPTSVQHLLAAGFTTSADIACQQDSINQGKSFATTHASVAFNPYQQINPDGSTQINEATTEQLIDYCRSTLQHQCVLENNSIRSPISGGSYPAMYAKIKSLGPPVAFQTAQTSQVGDLGATLQWAIDQGANAVELPRGYESIFTPSQLAPYNTGLKNNPQ